MIGILLVTHGNLGAELKSAAEYVIGKQEKIAAVGVFDSDTPLEKEAEIKEALEKVRGDKGTVILTDMCGGTPSNLALKVKEKEVEILVGVNLPMLLKLIQRRDMSLSKAVSRAVKAGGKYIGRISKFRKEKCKKKC